MLTGWQQIGDRTFYFRPSGAMQTGKATIDGVEYEFTASGTLKS
jgi:glucan-binding YG repeat protein